MKPNQALHWIKISLHYIFTIELWRSSASDTKVEVVVSYE